MNFEMQQAAAYNPSKQEPRPYVIFEMRAVEDRSKTSTDGVTHTVDTPWAIIRAAGSKDTLEKPAKEWLAGLRDYARNDRIPREWPAQYEEAFRLWETGQEIPVEGTAIKSWPPLSPAQRKNLLALGVLTIESLATANDEIMNRIGMGAVTLRQLAKNWIQESQSKGSMAQTLEAAMVKLAEMEALVKAQAETIATLQVMPAPTKVASSK